MELQMIIDDNGNVIYESISDLEGDSSDSSSSSSSELVTDSKNYNLFEISHDALLFLPNESAKFFNSKMN